MLALDEKALNDRFASGMDIEDLQIIVANQPNEDIDKTRIYCRWVIQPGASELTQSDGTYEQLGRAVLQIIAPLETWVDEANDVRDQFFALFRRWRSDDGATRVYKTDVETPVRDDCYMINCKLFWTSSRKS